MPRISRARRAQFQHRAAQIRQQGQRAAWDVATIADEIARQLPEVTPLEVWRLAYGWSRPQVVAAVLELYRHAGLAEPGLTSARLCRWEHDSVQPELDYAHALARVYQVSPRRLGITLSGIVAEAFTLSDYAGAHIHLSTGARLGIAVGETRLTGWSLGAQSMVAYFGDRPHDALDLAHQANEYADTALQHAQITAWCELRALAALGLDDDARRAATAAQRYMDAAARDEPGRFGFDRAELNQHLAETFLRLGDTRAARLHAGYSIELKTLGRVVGPPPRSSSPASTPPNTAPSRPPPSPQTPSTLYHRPPCGKPRAAA